MRDGLLSHDWGEFVRYVEVAADQFAQRQIEVFDNGHLLRYDRDHWCDEFGQMTGLKFSRQPKWAKFYPHAELITAIEFERLWKVALKSKLWSLQLKRSRVMAWGPYRVH